jgi:hypothetical protein
MVDAARVAEVEAERQAPLALGDDVVDRRWR